MKLLSSHRPGLLALLLLPLSAAAQEGTWRVSISGGFVSPSLSAVNETLDKTIRDWNTNQFVPIGPIGHFSTTPAFAMRAVYRYDRDVAISFSAAFARQKLNSSFRDTTVYLNLDRSVQTIDALAGLQYFLPPLLFDMEVSIVVDVGFMFARATAVSYNTRQVKNGNVYDTEVNFDTDAVYKKAKLIANAGALWTWDVAHPVFVKAEALYRFANMGKMDGNIRRLQGTFQEESITDFNFSGFYVQAGIGVVF